MRVPYPIFSDTRALWWYPKYPRTLMSAPPLLMVEVGDRFSVPLGFRPVFLALSFLTCSLMLYNWFLTKMYRYFFALVQYCCNIRFCDRSKCFNSFIYKFLSITYDLLKACFKNLYEILLLLKPIDYWNSEVKLVLFVNHRISKFIHERKLRNSTWIV